MWWRLGFLLAGEGMWWLVCLSLRAGGDEGLGELSGVTLRSRNSAWVGIGQWAGHGMGAGQSARHAAGEGAGHGVGDGADCEAEVGVGRSRGGAWSGNGASPGEEPSGSVLMPSSSALLLSTAVVFLH